MNFAFLINILGIFVIHSFLYLHTETLPLVSNWTLMLPVKWSSSPSLTHPLYLLPFVCLPHQIILTHGIYLILVGTKSCSYCVIKLLPLKPHLWHSLPTSWLSLWIFSHKRYVPKFVIGRKNLDLYWGRSHTYHLSHVAIFLLMKYALAAHFGGG